MLQARSCTPDFSYAAHQSPEGTFECHQQMDFSPVPVKGRFSSDGGGLTSPRAMSPSVASAYPHHQPSLDFNPFGCGAAQGPIGAMQTPIRPPVEVDYCQKVADLLKSNNDYYRTEAAPPMTQLSEYMFVGGIPSDETAQAMRQVGITHVINLVAQQCPTRPYISSAFTTSDFSASDSVDYYILMYHYDAFSAIVDNVRAQGGKVFVHCYAGVNRSVSLCVAYLLDHHREHELVDVIKAIHAQGRFYILDNVGFQQQLVEFFFRDVIPKRCDDEELPAVRFSSVDGHS